MLKHAFTTVEHWVVGPRIGRSGAVFYIAQVGDVWLLRCRTMDRRDIFRYYAEYSRLKADLERIDAED